MEDTFNLVEAEYLIATYKLIKAANNCAVYFTNKYYSGESREEILGLKNGEI